MSLKPGRWVLIAGLALLGSLTLAAYQNAPKAPWTDLPTDQPQTHSQALTRASQSYTVRVGGAVDGVMTRMPISYGAFRQGWQANRAVRLENVGDTDVINPWLRVNGRGDWRTLAGIVAEATRGCTTDADKARAIWEWQRTHRFHACTWDGEVDDVVKALNVYGYTLCGDEALCLDDLWKAAGLKTRPGRPVGHCVSEVFYDGEWHLLDSDEHVICLRRDNVTIAGEAEVVADHDLMKRTHTYSIGGGDSRTTDEFSASLYGYEGERGGQRPNLAKHTMSFTLRPGEYLEWRFSHVGKEYSNGLPTGGGWQGDGTGQLQSGWGNVAYDNLRNGKWVYRPPLARALCLRGVQVGENLATTEQDGRQPALHSVTVNQPATARWRVKTPYVIVGATVKCKWRQASDRDGLAVSFSTDQKEWQVLRRGGQAGFNRDTMTLDKLLSPRGKPMYEYYIQVELPGGAGAGLEEIIFDTDVQMSLLGMPELQAGDNTVLYTDDNPGPRQVRVTHEWLDRTAWTPPTAPAQALFPADGATVEGTQMTFKWAPAAAQTPEAKVADYHFELSARPDMRWPLSPNFEKLTSLTPAKGKPEWTVPYVGLLNPDTTYYWHVRAKDSNGVWGPWSPRFSFRCAAPGVPLRAKAEPNPATGTVDLTWAANPQGRPPVAYKVYGSDEQGFTVSDTEYTVHMGHGFCTTMAEYNAATRQTPFFGDVKTPANLVTKTTQTRLTVVGPAVSLPNANKAFYRVVAVDEKGLESGPSDLVALPRPWVWSAPVTAAKVGENYRYAPASLASIGHLWCNGSYNPGFWNRDKLTWQLTSGPAWLKLVDGVVTGIPPAAGRSAVALKVTNQKGQSAEQRFEVEVK